MSEAASCIYAHIYLCAKKMQFLPNRAPQSGKNEQLPLREKVNAKHCAAKLS